MARREPVIVVMQHTRVRQPDGRVIVLTPGCKSDAISGRIRSALPMEKVNELKARGRIVEETPPW